MNTKPIPAIITLVAAFICAIMAFVNHMNMLAFMKALLVVVITFLILGVVVKFVLDINFNRKEEETDTEEAESEEASGEEEQEVGDQKE